MALIQLIVLFAIAALVLWGFSRSKNEVIRIPLKHRSIWGGKQYFHHKTVTIPAKDREPEEYPPYYKKQVIIPTRDREEKQ